MADRSENDVLRGQRMRELRDWLGVSQEALAERMGQFRQQIIRAESGEGKFKSAKLRQDYADAAGVDLDTMNRFIDGKIDLAAVKAVAAGGGAATLAPHGSQIEYDNLEFEIEHAKRRGKPWSDEAVALARVRRLKGSDLPLPDWQAYLKQLERGLAGIVLGGEELETGPPDSQRAITEEQERRRARRKKG